MAATPVLWDLDLASVPEVSFRPGYDGDEWRTPPEVVAIVREAVGGEIDLDPASTPAAQEIVRARRFFTKADDGLTQPWVGRVFVNPPYSAKPILAFTEKLVREFDSGNIEAAVYLVNNCTDTKWFHFLLRRFPVCFTRGRIRFLYEDGIGRSTRQGQALFALGSVDLNALAQLGTIVSST